MRLVIDTNVLISAALASTSLPAHLIAVWRDGEFDLLTAAEQLDELMRVMRYPTTRERLAPAISERLIDDIRKLTVMVRDLPAVAACADPNDTYLLGIAEAGGADFLVTGDKRHMLVLRLFGATQIVTVRDFLSRIARLP